MTYTTYLHPDLVILLGTRAVLTGLASITILAATWHADRAWDDKEVRTEPDGILEYRSMNSNSNATGVGSVLTGTPDHHQAANNNTNTTAIRTRLAEGLRLVRVAYAGPSQKALIVAVAGWVLLLTSVLLLDRHEYTGKNTTLSVFDILTVLAAALIGILQTVVLPAAVQGRCVHQHVGMLATSWIGGWIALGVCVALVNTSSNTWMLIVLPIVACLLIASSPLVLWKSARKRGSNYDKGGPANIRPVLFNAAGPVVVTGWLLLWLALNAVQASPRSFYIPLYWSIRTVVALVGAALVVLVQYLAQYAHDEAPQQFNDSPRHHHPHDYYSHNNGSRQQEQDDEEVVETPAFGLDIPTEHGSTHKRSYFFGSANEMKFAFCLAWGVLASAAFLPTFAERIAQSILLFVVILVQGVVAGLRHERGIRAADNDEFEKWTFVEGWVIVAAAVLFLWEDGIAAGILAALGAVCTLSGEMLLHHDRKRGKHWMDTKEINPNFTVYSYGTLLFPLGMLLLAWGLSIP